MVYRLINILKRLILSMPAMGIYIIILAASIGLATFIEDTHGTTAAKALIYDVWWFEALFVVLAVNLINNTVKYNLWRKDKIAILLFHLAFIIIILGAGITRYFSFQGMMHIREGNASSLLVSNDKYITIKAVTGTDTVISQKVVLLSHRTPTQYKSRLEIEDQEISFYSKAYYQAVQPNIVNSPIGKPLLNLYYLEDGLRYSQLIEQHTNQSIGNIKVGFDNSNHNNGYFSQIQNHICYISTDTVFLEQMGSSFKAQILPGDTARIIPGQYIRQKNYKLIPEKVYPTGVLSFTPNTEDESESLPNGVTLNLNANNKNYTINVPGGNDPNIPPVKLKLDNVNLEITYGSITKKVPFEIYLNDFIVKRYPGSFSPSSFLSNVTVRNLSHQKLYDYDIYMNHVLQHNDYRFFQASYDTDELGTVLAVNQDKKGTTVSYIGYALMAIGMILSLFIGKGRFRNLFKSKALGLLLVIFLSVGYDISAQESIPSDNVSEQFGQLWISDNAGRIKPLNTHNRQVLKKLYRKSSYQNRSADQVILGIMANPYYWAKEKLIAVKNKDIASKYKVDGKYGSFNEFFDKEGNYRLEEELEVAYLKEPLKQSQYERDLIQLDERINIFNMVQQGQLLTLFPIPNSAEQPWLTHQQKDSALTGIDSLFVTSSLSLIAESINQNNNAQALTFITGIKKYQQKYAASILPYDKKMKAELLYSKLDLFSNLAHFFNTLGLIMICLLLMKLFTSSKWLKASIKVAIALFITGTLLCSFGIGLRWYISGYIPLSNSYESMIFIGWTALLAGSFLGIRNSFGFAIGSIFGGVALLMAFITNLNPEITSLVPVLKSYWLNIHVTIMMLGYAFTGSCAFLGLLTLIVLGLQNHKNQWHISELVQELNRINRVALIIGLYFLTIGCFLGGIWANESWGTYWSWDPKESWALVSILIYAFVAHIHHIPHLNSRATYALFTLLAFSSILMTYFGVNYLLGGMHSYAKSDGLSLPVWSYALVAVIATIIATAFYKEKKYHS